MLAAKSVDVFQHVFVRRLDSCEQRIDIVRAAKIVQRRAIVALDEDDQRVVELSGILQPRDDPAELIVGIGKLGGSDLHHARIKTLLVGRQAAPRGHTRQRRRQLRIGRDHTHFLLASKYLFADDIPSHVELAFELVDPLLGRLLRPVHGTWRIIGKEGFVGVGAILRAHPGEQMVGHVLFKDIVGIVGITADADMIFKQRRIGLIRPGGVEAIEIIEAHAARPVRERSHRPQFPVWRIVVLAEPGGVVTVIFQHLAQSCRAVGNDRCIARLIHGHVADRSGSDRMMVASGQQRRPRGRTHGRRVKLRVF